MRADPDNPPYITTVKLFGVWHINKMEYIRDEYQLTASRQMGLGLLEEQAKEEAQKWAESEGIGVR